MRNKHGLSRDIPSEIKRAVRMKCGFGCVICGGAIIEYEHIDPVFSEAKSHQEHGITLLCPGCHSKKTRGFLSKDSIVEAMKDPFAKQQGFSNELFDFGRKHPKITIGGGSFINCKIPIMIKGCPILKIEPPEEPFGPFLLTGLFYDAHGKQSLKIANNEWRPITSNWDVEAVGGLISIRDSPGHITLQIRATPPDGLVFEHIEMFFRSYRIEGDPNTFKIGKVGMGWTTFRNFQMNGCEIGFSLG